MKTRIDFKTEKGKFYSIRPTQQQTMDAELIYKTKYSEALRHGALTTAEASRIIDERSLWTEEDKQSISDLLMEVHKLGIDLKNETSISKGLEIVASIEQKRFDILKVNMKRNSILDNTSESYADEQRLQYYIVECTYNEDGKRVFKNKDELILASDEEHTVLATKFIIYLVANEGEDFRKDWPDYKWREEHGLVNEHMEPVTEFPTEFQDKLDAEEKNTESKTKKKKIARKRSPRKTVTKS